MSSRFALLDLYRYDSINFFHAVVVDRFDEFTCRPTRSRDAKVQPLKSRDQVSTAPGISALTAFMFTRVQAVLARDRQLRSGQWPFPNRR
jgi:hypothetical protein